MKHSYLDTTMQNSLVVRARQVASWMAGTPLPHYDLFANGHDLPGAAGG